MAAHLLIIVAADGGEDLKEKKCRVYRNRTRPLDVFSDEEMVARYRMPRHAIERIVDLCRNGLERDTQRSCPLSAELQILITLRYFGKGSFQSELADLHGVAQSSVSRTIDRTLNILSQKLDLIKFPKTATQQQHVKQSFFKLAGFPNTLGAVDGTLIPIIRPIITEEAAFVCRKGFHALNIQAICDADLRFTNVVCKWPGSVHDSFILAQSNVGTYLEGTGGQEGWLLGDSGYACRPWLMTPVVHPQSRAEEAYNKAHTKTRNVVERAFGLLKSRFRCLHKSAGFLPFKPNKCQQVVYVTVQLHNFCINLRLPPVDQQLEDEEDDDDNICEGAGAGDGSHIRRRLIHHTFA